MKKSTFIFAFIFAVLFSAPGHSQLKNMVLIEEATNASCGPCASQNPYLEQFLQNNSDGVIGVSYHAWWPGANDPMYTGDVTMNKSRITYYGFDQIGVPTCVVNGAFAPTSSGWYQGAPGDIDALTSAVSDAEGVTSPIAMMINRYTQSDSEQVRVNVSSTSAITNGYLRVIVVEGEHDYTNAGNNGETVFLNVARKMLPTYAGTKFSLAANEMKSFLFKYKYDAKWTTDQLSIIAFVQSNTDKSISAAVESVDPPAQGFLGVPTTSGPEGLSLSVVGNPLSENQTLSYTLGGNQPVSVMFLVIDLLGRTVQELRSELVTPGEHSLDIQTSRLASGAYHVIAKTPRSLLQLPIVVEH
jgi:hypothetical protein